MTLFVPSPTASSDLWDGGKTGQDGAVEFFLADEVRRSPRLLDAFALLSRPQD